MIKQYSIKIDEGLKVDTWYCNKPGRTFKAILDFKFTYPNRIMGHVVFRIDHMHTVLPEHCTIVSENIIDNQKNSIKNE